MTALTPIAASPVDRIPMLAPSGDTPRMTELRGKLALARSLASAGIGHWTRNGDTARSIYAAVCTVANQSIYAAVSVDHLEIAVMACRRLLLSATQVNWLEGDAP